LIAAWAEVQPDVMESSLGLLLGTWLPDMQKVLAAFLNAASDAPEHTVIVLDDYHLIEEPGVHQAMSFLLDNLPAQFHFVLAARGEAPLPLARYRARNEMLEIQTHDLQFMVGESEHLLNRIMQLDLPENEVSHLQAEVEGWAAGLYLVALALQRRDGTETEIAVSGRLGFIADYLKEDVMTGVPRYLRDFLYKTSILESLSAPLCNSVTGRDDSQEILETLARQNLFLTELDLQREWFRYHQLFADVLHAELERLYPEDIARLHQRASGWYLEHDLPDRAFQHAVMAQDRDAVTGIVDRHAYVKILSGDVATVERWMALIPAVWFTNAPSLSLVKAGIFLFNGQFDSCSRMIDDAERRLIEQGDEDRRAQLARVSALRCYMACFTNDLEQAESYAEHALQDLARDDLTFRAGIHGALGDTYRRNGYWVQAKQSYQRTLDFSHAPVFRFEAAHVYGALADLELRQGFLRNAASCWRKAIEACRDPENWGKVPLPVIGWVHVRMAEVLYEWNQLNDSRKHLSYGLRHAEAGKDVRAMMAGYVLSARLHMVDGEIQTASDYLDRARPLLDEALVQDWVSRFDRCQLELWLAQDRLRAAVHWSDRVLLGQLSENDESLLAIARVLIVRGDVSSMDRALTLLRQMQRSSEAEGRNGITVEVLALMSIGDWKRGDLPSAIAALQHALRLAEPEGYIRLFADLGLPMARLLQEAYSRDIDPEYVEQLLAASGTGLPSDTPGAGLLPDPLTSREQEVLELLASGLSNQEIAGKLFISHQTVKKHASNIYGKLGVGRRTEAVARARQLEMLH
jgi:LuxR family transcriptional regulator, maltose regulon positive regulatory protein